MQTLTPNRDYTHYDDVAKPLLFKAGTAYDIVEVLRSSGGDLLVVCHPDCEDDVVLRPEKIRQCDGVY